VSGRLLTFNCHEAWVHQLGRLGRPLDIVDGLPGRYTTRWDERMRPIPPGARLVSLEEVRRARPSYDGIVGHNLSDLLAIDLDAPRILVLHVTLEHRLAQAKLDGSVDELRRTIERYLAVAGGVAIAVTELKATSWGLSECAVVESAADPDEYLPWRGNVASGLRVANQIQSRRAYLGWDLHEAAFTGLPLRILGHNPDMPGVEPAAGWDDLKRQLASHRFFVHTAGLGLEDGFNMALMEALAAGMPVVGNRHPTSPVEHGVSGFLSDDPLALGSFAKRLLDDPALAQRMSRAAVDLARRRFSTASFVRGLEDALERARRRWEARKPSPGGRRSATSTA
jgi:hypothetical protein